MPSTTTATAFVTIQLYLCGSSGVTRSLLLHKNTVDASSKIFLAKVCPFVSLMASPKQPQSLTGLKRKIHNVTNVMKHMKTAESLVTMSLRIPTSRRIPRQNSRVDTVSEAMSVIHCGTNDSKDKAPR